MNNYICKNLFAAAAFGSMIVPLNAKEHEEQEVQADQTLPYVSSSWVNQGGSTMSLNFTATSQPGVYQITGSYVNNEAGFGCQGTSYPLSGTFYDGTSTMSFAVAWSNTHANCSSVTGWTGYLSYTDGRIYTDWNLAYRDSGGNPAIASGSDIFTRVQTKKLGSPFVEE